MAIGLKSQKKDTNAAKFSLTWKDSYIFEACFYKANESIVANIYQSLRFIQTQICYQQLVLTWEFSVLNQYWVLSSGLLSNKGLIRAFLIIS